jgi:carboxylate-amine ligase
MTLHTSSQSEQDSPQPFEDLTFQPSEPTIGVELELQILERETGEPAPGAMRILGACEDEGIEGVSGELYLSMLEVKTGICHSVEEARESLLPLMRRVGNIAGSLGYDLVMAGTHPFGRPRMSAIFPAKRYQRMQKLQGWLAYQEPIYGLHVHVGVPSAEAALGTINLLVPYLPHLAALSANSPFWQGIDTGYCSARLSVFRPSAHGGLPKHFESWDAFGVYCETMHACGAMGATKDIHWDIRPRPGLGTIEVRICDTPSSLAGTFALTALIRALVVDAVKQLAQQPQLGQGDERSFWLAQQNRWLASRYGLKARCLIHPGGEQVRLAEDTAQLIDRLLPAARELGDESFLSAFQPLDAFESGADRQRRVYRQAGRWQAVIDDLKKRWHHDLEPSGA